MIDLHAHILPGLDDGPSSWDQALEMCKLAQRDGIHTICATPHTIPGEYDNYREGILKTTDELRERLKKESIDINVIPGAEVYAFEDLVDWLENGKILTINDKKKNILLELPIVGIPLIIWNLIYQLRLKNITPIIVHPERNKKVLDDISIVHEFIRQGALIQINSRSLEGSRVNKARRVVKSLLTHNLVHVIASDAHSPDRRPPILSKAAKIAKRLVGEEEVYRLTEDNPKKIINGETDRLAKD